MRVLETRKKLLGEKHPDTLTAMHNLAFTLKSEGRSKEANSLMDRCYKLQKDVLGCHHPDTESSLGTLEEWRIKKDV